MEGRGVRVASLHSKFPRSVTRARDFTHHAFSSVSKVVNDIKIRPIPLAINLSDLPRSISRQTLDKPKNHTFILNQPSLTTIASLLDEGYEHDIITYS